MSNNSIFSDSFLANLSSVLETNCADNKSASSSVVCDAMGLPADLKHTIGLAINMGLVPNFKLSKGRGIYKDEPVTEGAPAKPRVKKNARLKKVATDTDATTAAKAPKFTDEFLVLLRITLEDLCAASERAVPRKAVAEAMRSPGTKTELMVSEALKLDSFSDFKIKAGRNGGIIFAAEALLNDDDNTVVLPDDGLDLTAALTMTEADEEAEVYSEL